MILLASISQVIKNLVSTKRDRRGSSSVYFGHALGLFLVGMFLLLYGVVIYQNSFWQTALYSGTLDLKDNCMVAAAVTNSQQIPSFGRTAFQPIQLPHHLQGVLPRAIEKGEHGHAKYRCVITKSELAGKQLPAYLSLGYVYGSSVRVFLNDQERITVDKDSRIFVPLSESDLEGQWLQIDVDVSSTFDDLLGFTGRAPVVIAQGTAQAERIFGQEVIAFQLYHFFLILSSLVMSLFLILAWIKGIRSRTLVATFFYFAANASHNIFAITKNVIPFDVERLRALKYILESLPELALIILTCEFLLIGRKFLKYSYVSVVVIAVAQFVTVAIAQDYYGVFYFFEHAHTFFFVAVGMTVLALYYRKRLTLDEKSHSQSLSDIVSVIFAVALLAVFLDNTMPFFLQIETRFTAVLNLFIPVGIGLVVAQNIALIQQHYHEEKQRREKMESDLELAKDIQDSLALPPPETEFAGMKVSCFQIKHSQVAGDWMAVRKSGEDEMIVLVADVTGKGVQAALVVHAIQSLWADALAEPTFDPDTWLAKVNRTLHRLGERRPHSATMGILSITPGRLRYWCMGHTPLFVVTEKDNQQKVNAIISRGGILGVNAETPIESKDFIIEDGQTFQLLLGSDGVFDKGSRTRPREVTEFLLEVKEKGRSSLISRDDNDDRTLVYVNNVA